jgi:hypothetical protein
MILGAVHFKSQGLRHGSDAAKGFRPDGHATAAEKASAQAKCPCASNRIQPEAGLLAKKFAALRTIRQHLGISAKRIDHRGQFPRRPPVITTEKGHDFSPALRDVKIEGRSLAAIGLAK